MKGKDLNKRLISLLKQGVAQPQILIGGIPLKTTALKEANFPEGSLGQDIQNKIIIQEGNINDFYSKIQIAIHRSEIEANKKNEILTLLKLHFNK